MSRWFISLRNKGRAVKLGVRDFGRHLDATHREPAGNCHPRWLGCLSKFISLVLYLWEFWG